MCLLCLSSARLLAEEPFTEKSVNIAKVNQKFSEIGLAVIKDFSLIKELGLVIDQAKTDLSKGALSAKASAMIAHSKWDLNKPSYFNFQFEGQADSTQNAAQVKLSLKADTQVKSFLKYFARETLDQYFQARGINSDCEQLPASDNAGGLIDPVALCMDAEKLSVTGELADLVPLVEKSLAAAKQATSENDLLKQVHILKDEENGQVSEIKIIYQAVSPGTEIYTSLTSLQADLAISNSTVTLSMAADLQLAESEMASLRKEVDLMAAWLIDLETASEESEAYKDSVYVLKDYASFVESYYQETDFASLLIRNVFF